jgi:hypothetical protein
LRFFIPTPKNWIGSIFQEKTKKGGSNGETGFLE